MTLGNDTGEAPVPEIRLAHISDLHIDGTPRAAARLRRVADFIAALRPGPNALVVTGDVAANGRSEEYAQTIEILRSIPCRVIYCPGNHDCLGPFAELLLGKEDGEPVANGIYRVDGALVITCDSTVNGEHHGLMSAQTLNWLEDSLARAPLNTPVFLAFHHPPVALHDAEVDEIRQFGTGRLGEIVRSSPNVVAILCGHAHAMAFSTFAGKPLIIAPGVASALRAPGEPRAAEDRSAPPAIALHILEVATTRLTTHYRVVD